MQVMHVGQARVLAQAGPARRRLVGVSAMRFLAAFWLLGYHLTVVRLVHADALPARLGRGLAAGSAITGLFIMLSGFMMYYAYSRDDGALRVTPRELWVGRFARLYPLMVVGHLLALPLAFTGEEVYGAWEAIGRGALVLTATQVWVPQWAFSYNGPAWTIAVLVACYAAFPWIAATMRGRGVPALIGMLVACWALMLLPTAAWFASLPTGLTPASDAPESFAEIALHSLPLFRIPDFIAGVVLARLFVLGGARQSRRLTALGAAAAIAVAAVLSAERYLPERFVANGLLGPLYWCVLLGVASAPAWIERAASRLRLQKLGDASLGLFLLQMPPMLVLAAANKRGLIEHDVLPWVLVAYVVGLVVLSCAADAWFVRPVGERLAASLGARLAARARPEQGPPEEAVAPGIPALTARYEGPTGSRRVPSSTVA